MFNRSLGQVKPQDVDSELFEITYVSRHIVHAERQQTFSTDSLQHAVASKQSIMWTAPLPHLLILPTPVHSGEADYRLSFCCSDKPQRELMRVCCCLQVHCGDAAVEAHLEQKINEACISFEKKPQEVAQVRLILPQWFTGLGSL
jgi:hypothetical protein